MGATGTYRTRGGTRAAREARVEPEPPRGGRTRSRSAGLARGSRAKATGRRRRIMPIVLHGDAAFAGQGITAEALNLADLPGYSRRRRPPRRRQQPARLHDARPRAALARASPPTSRGACRSRSSTSTARIWPAVVRVARLAAEFRYAFGSDVVIDMIGYRRHGHSEVDDPTITQPLMYRAIKDHPPLWEVYARAAPAWKSARPAARASATEYDQRAGGREEDRRAGRARAAARLLGAVSRAAATTRRTRWTPASRSTRLRALAGGADIVAGRLPHPPEGAEAARAAGARWRAGKRRLDYGMAEALAFGTLLARGHAACG